MKQGLLLVCLVAFYWLESSRMRCREEINFFKKDGMTEKEFKRSKEQFKASLIMSKESTASQMLLYGKNLLLADRELDFESRLKDIENLSLETINEVIRESFKTDKMAVASLGPEEKPLQV